jgi:hemerythrin-like domain-containing protein
VSGGRGFTRRQLIGGAAAGLVVGAGVTEGINAAAGGGSGPAPAPSAVPPPGERLMYEHGVLKRVLLVYQAALPRLDTDLGAAAPALHGGAEVIHDFIESFHEALEEGYVFPRLRSAGLLVPTVDTLLTQHARGREITQLLLSTATTTGLASAATRQQISGEVTAFVRMYEPHEAREDTVVFPAFRGLLGPGELEEVAETFAGLQDQQLGPDAFPDVLARVGALEESLGIGDLSSFTPTPVTAG